MLIWLTNERDYRKYPYRMELPAVRRVDYHIGSGGLIYLCSSGMSRVEWDQWIQDKVIGPPKATSTYSTKQLAAMGAIGIYQEMSWQQVMRRAIRRLKRFIWLRAPLLIVAKEVRLLWRKLWRRSCSA